MRHECDRIKCDKPAEYYAVDDRTGVDGFFCYWHYPAGWAIEPLIGGK